MNIHPSSDMREYMTTLFSNISNKFIKYLKDNYSTNNIHIHEDLARDDIYGELDIRIGDTIIDYKNTINDEISAPWILQLLCYKAMCNHPVNKIAIFNPLKGWFSSLDVSGWDKGE
jgi:hypothetical protein